MLVIARRFQPGVLLVDIQKLVRWLRPAVFRIRLPFCRWLRHLVPFGILIPGVSNVFGDLTGINWIHLGEIIVENKAPRQGLAGCVVDASLWDPAIAQVVPGPLTQ